jgi:hypothetical protein
MKGDANSIRVRDGLDVLRKRFDQTSERPAPRNGEDQNDARLDGGE